MITREQVADLRGGDVVELHRQGWADDVVVRGTLRGDSCAGELYIGDYSIFSENGNEPDWLAFPGTTLTVVSRAPRPLYVNHPRTEPVLGDVVRTSSGFVYSCTTKPSWVGTRERGCETPWRSTRHGGYDSGPIYDKGLRLLVDGETGQVVP